MSTEEREDPRERQQAPPSVSVSELLASCAAADAVSTPPQDPPSGSTADSGSGSASASSSLPAPAGQQERDAA